MLPQTCRIPRFLRIFSLALIADFASSAGLPAETVTLNSVEDTFLAEFDSHFVGPQGSSFDMVIGTQGAGASFARNHGLIKFDLSGIPAGSVINSVSLQMTVNSSSEHGAGPASNFRLHRLAVAWAEAESTWSIRLAPAQTWTTPGGAAGTDYAATSSASALIQGAGTYTFESTPALVADVNGWLSASSSNRGWLIKTEDESVGNTAGRFASKENSAGAPQLTIDFTSPVIPPHIDSASVAGNDFCLQFQARAGKSYVVQRRERADSGDWMVVTTLPPAAADGPVMVCDPLTGGNQFYRVGEQ